VDDPADGLVEGLELLDELEVPHPARTRASEARSAHVRIGGLGKHTVAR
jgi:hypothetical protein